MSRALMVQLSEGTYTELERHARGVAQSPAELAAAALEQRFGVAGNAEADMEAARRRFERHFGAVDIGRATGVDNEVIDADLARSYADESGAG